MDKLKACTKIFEKNTIPFEYMLALIIVKCFVERERER
jgi:hypothetical protein